MTNDELIENIKRNIYNLDWSMDDAPFHGFSGDNVRGVKFAINKILEGTGYTRESIHKEMLAKERDK